MEHDSSETRSELHEIKNLIHKVLRNQSLEHKELNAMSAEQDKIDADVAAIKAVTDGLTTANTDILAEIQALKDAVAAGQPVDFSALDAAVAPLQTIATNIEGIAPAPTPAP